MNHTIENDNIETITTVLQVMYGLLFLQFSILLYKSLPLKNIEGEPIDMLWDSLTDDEDDDSTDSDDDSALKMPLLIPVVPVALVKYEEKYMEKLKGLPARILNEEELIQLKNNYIMEKTPSGNVIMCWNNKKGAFTFYADSTIPYRFLEVVARKYVIYNQCKQLYIQAQPFIKDSSSQSGGNNTATADVNNPKDTVDIISVAEKGSSKPAVFAKLKSYNQASINSVKALQSNTNTSVNNHSQSNFETTFKKGEQSSRRSTVVQNDIKENANRYTCEGRIANFSFLKKEKKVGKKISFSEYKKIKKLYTNK